jgi:3-oxoacyl-[acyl-carrier protein] reductase
MDFTDKVVIVTGAARGLGQEYARQFARRGASVAVNDLRDCDETLEIIEQEGARGLATKTDVTSAKSTSEMAEAVVRAYGRIDVLVNNAALYGSLTFAPFDKLDEQEWDAAMNVNVKGIWQCCKAVRGLAREVGRYDIRVNAVAPNVVNTDATGEVFRDKKDKILEITLSQQAIRSPLETEDIVGAVLFLGSDHSRLTTGQTIMVDGGTVFL